MKFTKCLRTTVAAFAATAFSTLAFADEIYLKFPGSEILGDVTLAPHKDEIAVNAYSLGVSADSSWTKGGGASVGKAQPGQFVVNIPVGRAYPAALKNLITGQTTPSAVLSVNGATVVNGRPVKDAEYLRYTFSNIYFTDISHSGGGERGTVDISLVYKTVTIQVFVAGKLVGCTTWDVPAGIASSSCGAST